MTRRPKAYSKNKSVKAVARERIGTPRPARPIVDKAHRPKPKHKNLLPQDD
jgi:hypothetical protein